MNKERLHRSAEDFTQEKDWDFEGITVLRASVVLPQFEGRRARRLNRYYRRFAQSFLKYCESELYPRAAALCAEKMAVSAPWSTSRATLSYTVTHEDDTVLSLYADAAEENLPPRLTLRRADTWELKTALPLPLFSLLSKNECRRALQAAAQEKAERGEITRENYRRALRVHFSSRNFYLTPEGLCIFYQMHALGPDIVMFHLPLEQPFTDS